jgi:hypothetical protein
MIRTRPILTGQVTRLGAHDPAQRADRQRARTAIKRVQTKQRTADHTYDRNPVASVPISRDLASSMAAEARSGPPASTGTSRKELPNAGVKPSVWCLVSGSGGVGGWWCWPVGPLVAQQRPQDVDAPSGQGQHGLGVAFALGPLAVIEAAGLQTAADADQGGGGADALQAAVVAAGAVAVAADESRVPGCGSQPGEAASRSGVPKQAMSPPVAARNSAPPGCRSRAGSRSRGRACAGGTGPRSARPGRGPAG